MVFLAGQLGKRPILASNSRHPPRRSIIAPPLDSRGGNCGGLPWLTPGRQVQGQWKDQRCTPSQSAFVIEHQPQDKNGHEFPGGEDGPVRVCQSVAAGPPSSRTGEATAGGRRPPRQHLQGCWGVGCPRHVKSQGLASSEQEARYCCVVISYLTESFFRSLLGTAR